MRAAVAGEGLHQGRAECRVTSGFPPAWNWVGITPMRLWSCSVGWGSPAVEEQLGSPAGWQMD